MGIPLWQDIHNRQTELECKDWLQKNCPPHILANLERAANDPYLVGMDGVYYRDTRAPTLVADNAAITLSTTGLALWSTAQFSLLPANYWLPGRSIKMTAFGKGTSDGTASNWTWSVSASNAANTNLVSGTASAVTVSQTNFSWMMEGYITCRTIGATGTVQQHGIVFPAVTAFASTLQPLIIPASAPTTTTVDTTAAGGCSLQLARSGAGVHTATTTELLIEAF